VPLDRAATLRNAEKLLRQGKLDAAIAEYLRVVEEQPRDWNTANLLGDLYGRAGQIAKAVEQFARIADSLSEEGFLSKAGALYKKILKVLPDHEHALLRSAEISAAQGLFADARAALNAVAERRGSRGDLHGAAQVRIRLASLDPADFDTQMAAAQARVDIGDAAGALRELKGLAADLAEKGRETEAIEALRRAALVNPDDDEIRERLLHVYVAIGDFARARECASTVEQFKTLAAALDRSDRPDEALETLRAAARVAPGDAALNAQLARAFLTRGDFASAAEYLTSETAGDDPQLLLMVAESQLRGDRVEDGLALVRRIIAADPSRREQVAFLGWTIGDLLPEAGFLTVEVAADAAVAELDWGGAAAALQEFVTRVPNHVPALMRLVEICVDGGLDATMSSAQAQLADAYIAAGLATEARVIAEDLVAREPWERANIERFRRALVLLGEADPDALIAERLSGESPFMSTDPSLEDFPPLDLPSGEEVGRTTVEEAKEAVVSPSALPAAAAPDPPEPKAPPKSARARKAPLKKDAGQFTLGVNAVDVSGIFGDFDDRPASAVEPAAEVDLSVVLDDINSGGEAPPSPPVPKTDLEGVFQHLREEAHRQSALNEAEEQYVRGIALRDAGQIDESTEALEAAARAPRLRFAAASALGRMYRERGMMPQAIDWYERGAEAPPPSLEEGYLLLYELADMLESVGETSRALAICLELQADAGAYRDVAARVDRLANAQTRG
jgi:tetratricopeptide (TPR) repeat protein